MAKFILHEHFCFKNIIKCEKCGEPISREEVEEHYIENHKLEDCRDCGKKLEKRLFLSHTKKCKDKPTICTYCTLDVPIKDLHEHEYMCGSKTENCVYCGELIPIMGK